MRPFRTVGPIAGFPLGPVDGVEDLIEAGLQTGFNLLNMLFAPAAMLPMLPLMPLTGAMPGVSPFVPGVSPFVPGVANVATGKQASLPGTPLPATPFPFLPFLPALGGGLGGGIFGARGTGGCSSCGGSPLPFLGRSPCNCCVPPPPEMPQIVGVVPSGVCPGGIATVRIQVFNGSPKARDFELLLAPHTAKGATITPSKLSLGPLERGFAVATVQMPPDAAVGQRQELLIWIKGCKNHVVRWEIVVDACGFNLCHEIDVEDCVDYEHHWYDHFYCEHPCVNG